MQAQALLSLLTFVFLLLGFLICCASVYQVVKEGGEELCGLHRVIGMKSTSRWDVQKNVWHTITARGNVCFIPENPETDQEEQEKLCEFLDVFSNQGWKVVISLQDWVFQHSILDGKGPSRTDTSLRGCQPFMVTGEVKIIFFRDVALVSCLCSGK